MGCRHCRLVPWGRAVPPTPGELWGWLCPVFGSRGQISQGQRDAHAVDLLPTISPPSHFRSPSGTQASEQGGPQGPPRRRMRPRLGNTGTRASLGAGRRAHVSASPIRHLHSGPGGFWVGMGGLTWLGGLPGQGPLIGRCGNSPKVAANNSDKPMGSCKVGLSPPGAGGRCVPSCVGWASSGTRCQRASEDGAAWEAWEATGRQEGLWGKQLGWQSGPWHPATGGSAPQQTCFPV